LNKIKQKQSNQETDPRQRILEAALKVFAEKGRQGARTREIAQAADVNLAMLHYYYSSKDELYIRAVTPLLLEDFNRLKAAATSVEDPRQRLQAVVGVYFDFLKSNPLLPRLVMWELVTGAQVLKKIFAELLKDEKSDLLAGFRGIFLDGQSRGIFRPHNADQAVVSTVALCIFPFIAREIIGAFNRDLANQPDFLAAHQRHVLDLLLQALTAEGKTQPPGPVSETQPSAAHEQTSLTL